MKIIIFQFDIDWHWAFMNKINPKVGWLSRLLNELNIMFENIDFW